MKESNPQNNPKKYYDFLGNELFIGSRVVFAKPGYKGLEIASIIKFTPKGATLDKKKWNTNINRPFEWLLLYEEPTPCGECGFLNN